MTVSLSFLLFVTLLIVSEIIKLLMMSKISLKQMSNEDGWVRGADAKAVGLLSQGLGAGRSLPDDVRSL